MEGLGVHTLQISTGLRTVQGGTMEPCELITAMQPSSVFRRDTRHHKAGIPQGLDSTGADLGDRTRSLQLINALNKSACMYGSRSVSSNTLPQGRILTLSKKRSFAASSVQAQSLCSSFQKSKRRICSNPEIASFQIRNYAKHPQPVFWFLGASITSPRAVRDRLISIASFMFSPVT